MIYGSHSGFRAHDPSLGRVAMLSTEIYAPYWSACSATSPLMYSYREHVRSHNGRPSGANASDISSSTTAAEAAPHPPINCTAAERRPNVHCTSSRRTLQTIETSDVWQSVHKKRRIFPNKGHRRQTPTTQHNDIYFAEWRNARRDRTKNPVITGNRTDTCTG